MQTEARPDGHREEKHKIVFFIDKQEFTVNVHELTVKELIVDFAKEDPAKVTLGLREGNHIHKYTDLDKVIHLKDGMKFVLFHNEPTPVS